MSYATKYRFVFDSVAGTSFRIEIQKDGYSGSVKQRALGQSPHLRRDSRDNGICGTSLEIYAECSVDMEFSELYATNPLAWKVLLQMYLSGSWTTIWTGFVSPELYSEPEIAPPYDVCITAVDGLGELKIYDFPANGRQSIRTHLQTILAHTGLDTYSTDIISVSSLRATSPSISAANFLANTYVNLDHLSEGNCYEALQAIMESLHMTITRYNNKWLLIRDSDVEVSGGAIAARNASGTAVSLPVAEYGSMTLRDWWPVGQMETEIVPAKKRITAGFPYRVVKSLFINPETANPYCGVNPPPINVDDCPGWDSIGTPKSFTPGSAFYGNHALIGKIQQTIAVEAQGSFSAPDQMNLVIKLAGIGLVSGPNSAKVRVKVFLTSSGGTGPWLKKKKYADGETDVEWVTTDSYFELTVPVGYYAGPPDLTFTEFPITLPYMPGGNLTIQLDGSNAENGIRFSVGGVYLTKPTINGYRDDIIINNNAREAESDIEIHFGDRPYVTNALASVLNILSDSNGNLTSEWATSQFTGEFLSVIAMDYALAAALPRQRARGTLNVPKDTVVPAAFVNPNGIPMLFNTWDWALFEDEVEVNMISIPAAEVQIDTETITQLTDAQAAAFDDGQSSGSGGGAGIAPSGGGGPQFFEAVEGTDQIVGARAIYDLYVDQDPEAVQPVRKNITEILRHLSLQVVNPGTASAKTILVSDITFASTKNLISGGIDGGGDTPAGGSIATLVDVTLANLAGGDTLVYNQTSNHWENKPLLLANLGDVDGTPSNGQTLIYDATTGKWKPGSAGGGGGGGTLSSVGLSMPTGFTVANSPLTADGTLSVTFASGYGLVTDTERGNFHTHSNKSVLDGITSTKVSHWDSAYDNIGKASYDASGKALATQQWVGNQGFITSSAISDMATKTWVGQQNYITETALSGYATQQWVTSKGYTTLTAVAAYLSDEGYATQTWVGQQGYLTGVSVSSNDATIGTDLTTIATVQGTAIKAKIASYLLASEFTATGIKNTLGTTAVNRATADASGNTITSSYLRKDTDDTMAANLAIGAQTSTSTAKKLTIYGRTTSSNPALVIVGVASGTTRYTTNIWRDDTYLQVGSSVYMSGNLVTTGNQTSGNASDRRLKDDIRDIKLDEAEEMLAALHPVTFRWNEMAGELSDGQLTGVSRGFIADELLAQMPGAGRKIWGEYDAIYYEQVIPYLVAGWKQQNLRIRILEGDMRIVRAENESLRRRLRRYEQQ